MRRFLLDNDGSNIFYNLGTDVTAAIMETVRECAPGVTTYLLCSGAGTCYYPTRVGDVNPRCTGLLDAHGRGEDPFGLLLRALKASEKEVFITCRMNDVHDPTDTWNLPRVRREHPDCIVGMDEVRRGKDSWLSYCMDYANPVVRHYSLALIREQVWSYTVRPFMACSSTGCVSPAT